MVKCMKINKNRYLANLITRVLLIVIFLLFVLILNKYNKNLTLKFKNELFNKSLNFASINKVSQKVLGKDVFYYENNTDSIQVISNEFSSSNSIKYLDATKITVSDNLPIGSISSGVVVFMGEKENYGNTVIIQGLDGYSIWYANIKDLNVKMYDYIEKQNLIGAANGDFVYLLIEKNNKFYSYDEYVQNQN